MTTEQVALPDRLSDVEAAWGEIGKVSELADWAEFPAWPTTIYDQEAA